MDNAPGQTADSFHPPARLAAALTLGVLGAGLIGSQDTFFGPQPHIQTWNLFAWLLAAAGAIFLLHRIEHVRTPRRLWVFVGLALAISLVPAASEPDIRSMFDRLAWAKMGALGLLLPWAGVVLFGLPALRSRCPIWRVFLRALALALTAPFLLYAAHERNDSARPRLARLYRVLFALFPLALAVGVGIVHLGWGQWRYPRPAMAISHDFLLWTWIGCALIFLLGPWPDEPGRKRPVPPSKLDQIGWVLLLAAVSLLPGLLMFLAPRPKLGYLAMYGLLFLLLYGDVLLLLLMLMPWPRFFPKLSEPPPRGKMGTVGTTLLLVLPWLGIGTYFMGAFRGLFSGRLFAEQFDPRWLGWALDQSNLSSGFFRYTSIMAALMAYVAAVRWLADRRGFWRRGAFTLCSLPLFLFPFSHLTCIAYSLLLYVQALGFTTLRVLGLLYGALCYVILFVFLRWLWNSAAISSDDGTQADLP